MAGTSVHRATSTRNEQKKRTREALLDAAAGLLEHQNLSSLGLREVTRAVGIAPAAFYRHFRDMDELGAELVERSLGELLPVIREARRGGVDSDGGDPDEYVRRTLDVLAAYVQSHHGPFRIIARERSGGVALVRRAIAEKLRQATGELADDLARMPGYRDWQRDDITMIAAMFVNHVVQLSSTLLDVPADAPDEARRLVSVARRQLQLIIVGRRHWLSERPRTQELEEHYFGADGEMGLEIAGVTGREVHAAVRRPGAAAAVEGDLASREERRPRHRLVELVAGLRPAAPLCPRATGSGCGTDTDVAASRGPAPFAIRPDCDSPSSAPARTHTDAMATVASVAARRTGRR